MKSNTFDTIVIGAGMSGGWAAKEFSEQGFKTLLLERGPNVEHLKDYPTTNTQPWEFKHRGRLTAKEKNSLVLQSTQDWKKYAQEIDGVSIENGVIAPVKKKGVYRSRFIVFPQKR